MHPSKLMRMRSIWKGSVSFGLVSIGVKLYSATEERDHRSQGERLYMHEEKIRSAAHFRGVQVDLGQTEGFIPYKLVL